MLSSVAVAETTQFYPRSTVWQGDRASGQPFKLSMRMQYAAQRICYRPGFWQEVKVGWIQYAWRSRFATRMKRDMVEPHIDV